LPGQVREIKPRRGGGTNVTKSSTSEILRKVVGRKKGFKERKLWGHFQRSPENKLKKGWLREKKPEFAEWIPRKGLRETEGW